MNHPTTPVRPRHVVAMADRLSESAMDVAEYAGSSAAFVDWAPGYALLTRKYHLRRQALIRLARALDARTDHGAWPQATYRADWQLGAVDRCATCSAPLDQVDFIGAMADAVVRRMAGEPPAGSDQYERPADPDPGAGRRGARFGAVTDDGVQHD